METEYKVYYHINNGGVTIGFDHQTDERYGDKIDIKVHSSHFGATTSDRVITVTYDGIKELHEVLTNFINDPEVKKFNFGSARCYAKCDKDAETLRKVTEERMRERQEETDNQNK